QVTTGEHGGTPAVWMRTLYRAAGLLPTRRKAPCDSRRRIELPGCRQVAGRPRIERRKSLAAKRSRREGAALWRKGWDSNPRGSVNPLAVFKTAALNHSATLPYQWDQ